MAASRKSIFRFFEERLDIVCLLVGSWLAFNYRLNTGKQNDGNPQMASDERRQSGLEMEFRFENLCPIMFIRGGHQRLGSFRIWLERKAAEPQGREDLIGNDSMKLGAWRTPTVFGSFENKLNAKPW